MTLEKVIIWDDYLSHALHLDFARRKHAREIKNEILTRKYDGFVIRGSENFIERTISALTQLKSAPEENKITPCAMRQDLTKKHLETLSKTGGIYCPDCVKGMKEYIGEGKC